MLRFHGGTYPVVNSLQNFIVEVTSCVSVANWDCLRKIEACKHVTSIRNVGNEQGSTSVSDGAVGDGATIGIQVARSTVETRLDSEGITRQSHT